MYSLYIPKYKKEDSEFLIAKVIREYTKTESEINCLLSSPGYLSRTKERIDEFVENMCNLIPCKESFSIGFFNGMNGNNSLGKTTIVEYHNMCFEEKHVNTLKINCKKQLDHRKMIFFIYDSGNYFQQISMFNNSQDDKERHIDRYINNIKVKGMLIGSSNQSNATYFSIPASKGEADLLMFTDSSFAAHIRCLIDQGSNYPDNNFNGCVLSKSIAGCMGGGEEFLKSILKDFLLNNIL